MSRKPKKGPKRPRVVSVLESQTKGATQVFQGSGRAPPGAVESRRLHTVWNSFPYDPRVVAQSIAFNPSGLVFCDSTTFLAHTDQQIWDAILPTKRAAILGPLIGELKLWLGDPRGVNLRAHAGVKTALDREAGAQVRVIDGPPAPAFYEALIYYVALLGIRKQGFAIARSRLGQEKGTQSTNQEVSDYLRDTGGTSRAQLLARQGQNVKVPDHLYNDERLVVSAVIQAIGTGKEVTIVTSDEAVLDQFCKCVDLVSWHYLAMLLGERYSAHPKRFATRIVGNIDSTTFSGEKVTLVPRTSPLPLELLPSSARYVFLHCILIQNEVTRVSFLADADMARLLHMKRRTGGLNSDKFNGQNCHLFPGEVARTELEGYSVIATDQSAPIGRGMSLSALDLGLCLTSNHQVSRTHIVDPRILQLPSGYRT